jgi:DNA-directed RNA polymerase subunit E'/Rpb7
MIKDIIITEQITIPPKLLNDKLMSTIESIFSKKVIGRCDDTIGYIMELIQIQNIKGGNIIGDNANVIYDVSAKVKSFMIDKDEIINAIVTKIDSKGLFAQAGPFQIYVSVSKIPSSYRFENGTTPSFIKEDGSNVIKLNSMIPIKVIGKKLSGVNKMVVGSID